MVVRQSQRSLIKAVSEGHDGCIDEVFWHFGLGETVEARVDGVVEDGAVLHRKSVNKILKVVFCVLVQESKRHSVKVGVEPNDAQVKSFRGWGFVFWFLFLAASEGGQHDDERQGRHRENVLLHIHYVFSVFKFE